MNLRSTRNNTIFLAIGGLLASFIGTVVGTPRASATESWEHSFSHQCEVFGMIGRSEGNNTQWGGLGRGGKGKGEH